MIFDKTIPGYHSYRVLSLLFAFAMSARVMGFLHSGYTYPAFFLALFITAFAFVRYIGQFDSLTMTFLLYIPVSILLTAPAPIFNSWMRYGLFTLLLFVCSPLIKAEKVIEFRWQVMRWILIISLLLGVGSFIAYFIGINYMRSVWDGSQLEGYQGSAGLFGGLTAHSMLLAPISSIGTITATYIAIARDNKKYWLLAAMCFAAILFSASRVSLLATICGEVALIYYFSAHKSIMVKRLVGIMFLAIISYPLWSGATEGINKKNKGDITSGINTDSRSSKWNIRIEEWEGSPIFGIGFAAVSERDEIGFNGMVEPGSSWLALLSMTGIIGFGLFLAIFIRAIKNTLMTNTPIGALLGGILVMSGVHMMAEGYIHAGGSFNCFLVWLALGCATYYDPNDFTETDEAS